MPTRILRDWTDSEPVNELSANGERTFVRVIMKADDYGRLTGNLKLLRPLLYPLLLEQVREADLQRWIAECVRAGLVRPYSVEGKQYIVVVKFEQRLRNTRPKYPAPPDNPPQVAAGCGESRPDSEADSETEVEADSEAEKTKALAPSGAPVLIPDDLLVSEPEIRDWLEYKAQKGQRYKPKGLDALWRAFRAIHPSKRREAVDWSMGNNWSGLFEKKGETHGKTATQDRRITDRGGDAERAADLERIRKPLEL